MGAWGVGTFENDDASDWVFELDGAKDLTVLSAAFDAINDETDCVDAPLCSNALAAAEVVAALLGNPGIGLPDEVLAWVSNKPRVDASVINKARKAIAVVLSDKSELFALWAEAEPAEFDQWKTSVADINTRLK